MSKITIVVDQIRTSSPDQHGIFSGWQWEVLRGKLLRAGLAPDACSFVLLSDVIGYDFGDRLILGMGEAPLRHFTGKSSIDKWQLSPLVTKTGLKYIPTYDLGRIQKQYELGLYVELAAIRAQEECGSRTYARAEERFLLNPGVEETMQILKLIEEKEDVAIDVETGYGQINTVGFAWSPSDAIAINVLPERLDDNAYYELWNRIRAVIESPSRKVFQNFIYDTSYFSAYGVRVNNIHHDTMHGMKVLWPELKSNLGNVGRLYTKRPYWKDDGKVTDEEGGTKDWGNVRDWRRHYEYNCRDTTGTFEAAIAQREDLRERGLIEFFDHYVMRLTTPILEMCAEGFPLSLDVRARLRIEAEEKVKTLSQRLVSEIGRELNYRSPKQLLAFLHEQGVAIPKKYNKKKGAYQESTDSSSIKKIRLKYPEMKALGTIADVKTQDTFLSRYIDFVPRPDGRLSYSLNATGTETLRFSGGTDAWDRGFNIQTIPREGGEVSIKQMFVAPEGYSFIEVDLRQAESRFVAYDSADKTLIDMLESGEDVHTYVANEILKAMGIDPATIPKEEFKGTWRQLGKKAGHGLNYYMKANVFVETVFNELDIVITKQRAELITKVYYGIFPGIPRWHSAIRKELFEKRMLKTPFGWERYFYGRLGDDMFKEAYAFRPQSTIPWLTNSLMLALGEMRTAQKMNFRFLVQVHDSLIMLAPDEEVAEISKSCLNTKFGHPIVDLQGGRMYIPRECKAGKTLATMKEIT